MERGQARSRTEAQRFITAGQVRVEGVLSPRPATLVGTSTPIVLGSRGPRFVSRGGEKLDHALGVLGLDPEGKRCLDAGASTGGFTDVLLQREAGSVTALDVGYGQLHPRLARDSRVEVRDRTNLRYVNSSDLGLFEMLVVDLSFISLCTVAARLCELAEEGADCLTLVKPQFEAGRRLVGKKGVVKDPMVHSQVIKKVGSCLQKAGLGPRRVVESPLLGAKSGNREFFIWSVRGAEHAEGWEER
ncbi:MAG: TlyA family RNA methyltransferase [Actinomycetia bacterium]|nr:TlyA family RNA methyltransferase [Actinomycetes bacterium]MCQ3802568.1 TlyA family RNA methyltransferase [Acidimicrobiia bacterium]